MRRANVLAAALLLVLSCSAYADTPYYESATMAAGNQNGGKTLGDTQFIGARFVVNSPVTVDRIGGHIGRSAGVGNEKLFGAIVKLSGLSDMPDSLNLSTPDVLASTTFIPPIASADVTVPIGPLTLVPGTYGVLFGSSLFGATGYGFIPQNSADIGSPSYFWRDSQNPPQWRTDPLLPARLTVYAVPEPASLSLLATGMLLLRRRRAV